jgi:uncharacterized membrane protein YraQ (UPF0718 family)
VDVTPLQTALLLLLVSFAGALLPLYRRWTERGLHLFVSVSAGIFLGTIFLHLLPHLAGVDGGHGHAESAHDEAGSLGPWIAAMVGLLFLFFLERVWLRRLTTASGADPHTVLWLATYAGLSLHSFTAGIALNAILEHPAARTQFLISILIHKATETFSLATVMRLAGLSNARAFTLLFVFAAIEPLGLLFGSQLAETNHAFDTLLTGFACGTFLYVAVCDLLPEVFHGVDRALVKLGAVLTGIGITAVSLPQVSLVLDFGQRVLASSVHVFVDMAPFLILGFLLAGVLNQVMKPTWLTRRLAGDDFKSVAIASLIGAPLPLCSCSVLPVAASMRRSGASKGATSSFVIATPETGVDSVLVSWALLDPFLTIARPLGALVSAMGVGSIVNWLVRRRLDETPRAPAETAPSAAACGDHEHAHAEHAHATPAPTREVAQAGGWLSRVVRYAFVDMLDDLMPSMILGIVLSGLIATVIPAELFQSPWAHGFAGLFLMLVIGIPVYVCAAASTPIAAALILKGMSPGAAFVFLLAGPATNAGSLVVLSRVLGGRVVVVQTIALAVITLMLGWLVDQLYPLLGLTASASVGQVTAHLPEWISQSCAVVLALWMGISLLRTQRARSV